jgi:hypothetical protein
LINKYLPDAGTNHNATGMTETMQQVMPTTLVGAKYPQKVGILMTQDERFERVQKSSEALNLELDLRFSSENP